MPLILRDCYHDYRGRFALELAAGEAGLSRIVKWVYVTEDESASDFLRGGELIVTTGLLSGGSPQWLLRFLSRMLEQNTCGLILNLGPYLHRDIVTPEVLAFCEQHRYPLFLMPWHIHIYDITRCFYDRLFLDNRRSEDLDIAFTELLHHPEAAQPLRDKLSAYGFPPDSPYFVTVISGSADHPVLFSDHRPLTEELSAGLLSQPVPAHLLVSGSQLILTAQCDTPGEIRPLIQNILSMLAKHIPADCCAGIGSRAVGLNRLYRSRQRAQDTLRLGCTRGQQITCYDDTGFFRILMNVSDRDVLQNYVRTQLGAVHDYDKQHHSDLSRTLYLYLLHRGSVQAVAAHAFCHRNTINHRVHILKDTLGIPLDDAAACFELMSAFLTEEYLKSI